MTTLPVPRCDECDQPAKWCKVRRTATMPASAYWYACDEHHEEGDGYAALPVMEEMHPTTTGPDYLDADDQPARIVRCPYCGQMEWWTEKECVDHGHCRALVGFCPVWGSRASPDPFCGPRSTGP